MNRADVLGELGRKATGFRNRVEDRIWDARLGVSTAGRKQVHASDATRYESLAYSTYQRVLARLAPGPEDVILDLGCGKGRVLCAAARWPVRRVVGVEIDGELASIARLNASRMRGARAPIEVIHGDARETDFSAVTVILMFNPFGEATMREVVDRLAAGVRAAPRTLRIAYWNPVHEKVLAEAGWLLRSEEWVPRPWGRLKARVSFWRTW